MSILSKLGAVSQLKELLTAENLEYLDKVLTVMLTPSHEAYNAFWIRFQETFGGDKGNAHFTKAATALQRLHAFVQQAKRGGA